MAIIEVNHVTKEFKLGQLQSLKTTALNQWRRLTGQPVEERKPFKALDDVTFSVEQGEVLGIIGHNGAGKSTMLKLLANISKPSGGSIQVKGKIAPLIEVGAGLVGDLTGRENIYLNGAILGMPKKEIDRKFDDIVAFAELEEFIDTPIKRYSSGMQVRLGFSVATSVESDILIVDEVLAVGDLAFQRKCFDRMEDLIKRQGKTVLLVSHNIRQVERLCSRVILLNHGGVIADGEAREICNLFYDRNNQKILHQEDQRKSSVPIEESDEIHFVSIETFDDKDTQNSNIEFLRPMRIRVTFEAKLPVTNITFYIGIHTTDFLYLTASNTADNPADYEAGHHAVDLEIKSMRLLPGVYCLLVWIGTSAGKVYFHSENLTSFKVTSRDFMITRQSERGLLYLDDKWNLNASATVTPVHSSGLRATDNSAPGETRINLTRE